MKEKSWITSAWTISIGTAIFSLFLTVLYDYLKNIPILSTIIKIFGSVWNGIFIALNFEVKIWWLLVGIMIVIAIILVFVYMESKETNVSTKQLPEFLEYKEDKFNHWKWTWEWEWSSFKTAWLITNLRAHCPKCDTPLADYSGKYDSHFNCPRCNFTAFNESCDNPFNVESIILDNIARKRKTLV